MKISSRPAPSHSPFFKVPGRGCSDCPRLTSSLKDDKRDGGQVVRTSVNIQTTFSSAWAYSKRKKGRDESEKGQRSKKGSTTSEIITTWCEPKIKRRAMTSARWCSAINHPLNICWKFNSKTMTRGPRKRYNNVPVQHKQPFFSPFFLYTPNE